MQRFREVQQLGHWGSGRGFSNTLRYEGSLHQGMRHGQGVYIAKDGHTRYSGQWHMGRRHGFGELVYPDD
eukprot:2250552-Amphidinium_carterae.1